MSYRGIKDLNYWSRQRGDANQLILRIIDYLVRSAGSGHVSAYGQRRRTNGILTLEDQEETMATWMHIPHPVRLATWIHFPHPVRPKQQLHHTVRIGRSGNTTENASRHSIDCILVLSANGRFTSII